MKGVSSKIILKIIKNKEVSKYIISADLNWFLSYNFRNGVLY